SVRVVLDKLEDSLIGRRVPQRKSFFTALAQLWRNPAYPEVRELRRAADKASLAPESSGAGKTAIFLQDVSAVLSHHRTAQLRAGEFFGEIASLNRTPRTSTILADEETELLEIRWQGLREIRL